MNGTMADAAQTITAEAARKYWEEARKWKRLAEKLGSEISMREAAAEIYTEVRHGIVIFREEDYGR